MLMMVIWRHIIGIKYDLKEDSIGKDKLCY